jgi:hypothetical protein
VPKFRTRWVYIRIILLYRPYRCKRQYKCYYCKSQRFSSAGEQTIYIKIKNKTTNAFCNSTLPFQLLDAPITPKKINDIELCDIVEGNKINLTQNNLTILDGLDSKLYAFSYYSSEKDAANNSNSLSVNYPSPRLKDNYNLDKNYQRVKWNAFTIMSFNIVINPLPVVDVLPMW